MCGHWKRLGKMKKIFLTFIVLLTASCLSAQLFKKKQTDCPTYSESILETLSTFDAFSFEQYEQKKPSTLPNQGVSTLKPDNQSVDSVLNVLKKYYETKIMAKGYRIQLWTGQDHMDLKSVMNQYKASFGELEHQLYDAYDKTTFRFKIGDFTDRLEAYRCLQIVQTQFPKALLVPDDVYLKYL